MRSWLLLLVAGCSSVPKADPCAVATFLPDEAPEVRAERWLNQCGLAETIELTKDLVKFPTVRAEQEAADGKAFVGMASYLKRWSENAGLTFETFGKNDAWEVHLGDGEPRVAFVLHADVVPVDPKQWTVEPFEAVQKGDRLYGRGTEDDKGPIAAVLVSMRAYHRFGVPLPGRISAVMGTGEEHDWDGMVAYAKSKSHAKHVISLDANFPVVIAESGFVAWRLAAPVAAKEAATQACLEIGETAVGQFLTQVPGEASLEVRGVSAAELTKQLPQAAAPFRHRIETTKHGARVIVEGEAIHSSQADQGHNALWGLAEAAASLDLCPGGVTTMLSLVKESFVGDHFGSRLGLSYDHPLMGKLLVAPTMLSTDADTVTLSVNMRRPAGKSVEAFEAELDRAFGQLAAKAPTITQVTKRRYVGKPAMVDADSPLVKTLLEIYAEKTGATDPQPISIRGGTYARLFPGAVSFGPNLPGKTYRGHTPDEYVELDALRLMLEGTFAAMVRLRGE